jgi:hypothetical protein
MRRKQKDDIKNIIKKTKTAEKSSSLQSNCARQSPPELSHSVPTSDTFSDALGRGTRASSLDSSESFDDFNQPYGATPALYDSTYSTPMFTSNFTQPPLYDHQYPYEVDIKTERQMYVNDIPTRHDSSISTFTTFQPPPPHATLPSYTGDDWIQQDFYETRQDSWSGEEGLDFNFFDFSHGPILAPTEAQTATIPVDECDRELLDHFIDNVLWLIFPILEVNQHGSFKQEVILPALATNKCYLHCCLSIAAIHMKATKGLQTEQIDNDIVRHRYETVSALCQALSSDTEHQDILEATLGMIFFQCSVGRPDDCLPDVPWHQHFQAATSVVTKLDLPRLLEEMSMTGAHPPFNMTLTSWIDILGSTMLGRVPAFAHTYRNKHLTESPSGLCELMGCEDKVMYLLSEIACLDALRQEMKVDDIACCTMITSLAQQLDQTETHHEALQIPYSNTGALRPKQLSRNITAVFRIAARVYLCTLVPDYNRYQQSIVNLVARLAETLHFIPSGPEGFDRSLVWPLLICGSFSTPASPFRRVFAERCERLGEQAEFGSFGRMVRLLHEVWRRADADITTTQQMTSNDVSTGAPGTPETPMLIKNQNVHWRDVMQQNGWDFLLI